MFTILAAMALAAEEPASNHICETVGSIAHATMMARQKNASMAELRKRSLEGIDKMTISEPDRVWLRNVVIAIIQEAYSLPSWHTPENKADAVMRFRNNWEVACFEENP